MAVVSLSGGLVMAKNGATYFLTDTRNNYIK